MKQQVARRVESLFALADQLEARLVKVQRQVDTLTPSLLAFAGEIHQPTQRGRDENVSGCVMESSA